jgi:hypothetical protein
MPFLCLHLRHVPKEAENLCSQYFVAEQLALCKLHVGGAAKCKLPISSFNKLDLVLSDQVLL